MTIGTLKERYSLFERADEHGVLWLIDAEGVRYQLAVVSQCGWRIVDTTPTERSARGARIR
jgi:hypothetical protein